MVVCTHQSSPSHSLGSFSSPLIGPGHTKPAGFTVGFETGAAVGFTTAASVGFATAASLVVLDGLLMAGVEDEAPRTCSP